MFLIQNPSNLSYSRHQNRYHMGRDVSKNVSIAGGMGVPPLLSSQVWFLYHFSLISAGTWILFTVSCLFLPSAAVCSVCCWRPVASNWVVGCVWHASDVIFFHWWPPSPCLAALFLLWAIKVWAFWSSKLWLLIILVSEVTLSWNSFIVVIWQIRTDLILVLQAHYCAVWK